tara:strand:+ start:2363 stop:2593 length:231 start_codon:yes stop_codon:yes gene_type:complete
MDIQAIDSTNLGLIIMSIVLLLPSVWIVRSLLKGAGPATDVNGSNTQTQHEFTMDLTSIDLVSINRHSMMDHNKRG